MITLTELIDWLKADSADADLIEDLRAAAIAHIENETGMRWGTAGEVTETITWQGWPMALRGTVDTEADLTLEQWTGSAWEAVSTSNYYVDGAFVRPAGTSWSFADNPWPRFRATYTTGFVEGLQPAPILLAVRKLVQMWYDGDDTDENRNAVRNLLAPYVRTVV